MSYEDRDKAKTAEAAVIEASLAGKTIQSVRIPVDYPAQFEKLELVFTDGTSVTVTAPVGGCERCDPDGLGWGVNINVRSKS